MSLQFHFDDTLGAAFIGNTVASMLYGITSLQTFLYFRSQYRDVPSFKILIAFLWLLDSVHIAFTTHGLYFYLVKNFTNPFAIINPTWSILAQVYITCLSDLIVRSVFARRVWLLSGRNHYLALLVVLISLYVFGAGLAFATEGFILGTFIVIEARAEWMLYSALGGGVAADVLVAASLCISLQRSRTGFKRTDSLVNVLMLYTINTGLLTSVCAAACFITFAIWPQKFIFMGIYFALSKLYLNSLLAVLNSRSSLREQSTAGGGTTFASTQALPYQMKVFTVTESTSDATYANRSYGRDFKDETSFTAGPEGDVGRAI